MLLYPLLWWRTRRAVGAPAAALARTRHDKFLLAAPSYAELSRLAALTAETASAESVRIAGLTWWVPADDRKPGSLSSRVLAGELPLAEIQPTRSFGRGGVMIDIGANIGTTMIPRLLLGDIECAYGAEPDAANFACLTRTIADNHLEGRVMVERVALGATDGEAQFLKAGRIGRHRLVPADTVSPKTVPVPCLTLDTWTAKLGADLARVSYVNCDTQGWEAHVLAGAPKLLARKDIVWELEICPPLLEAAGSSLDALCATVVPAFKWFVDLRSPDLTPRPIDALASAVRTSLAGPRNYTNVILHNLDVC